MAPEEWEGNCDDGGNESWPEEHCWAGWVGSRDHGCNEDSLDCPLKKHYCESGEASKELLVGEVGNWVERPAGDLAVSKLLTVEDSGIGGLEAEVEEPVDECKEPHEPEGDYLSELGLEVAKGGGGIA